MINRITLKLFAILEKLRLDRWQVGTAIMLLPMLLALSGSSSVPAEKARLFPRKATLSRVSLSPQILAQKERRTALVIGNGAYGIEGKLNNPSQDASDTAKTLQGLGFEVTLLRNADKRQIEEAIEQFNSQLRQGGVGVFYYAGHGVQVQGENYLIPIGAKINREQDVAFEAVPLGRILGAMEDAKNPVNLVLIDACRNNPFSRRWRSSSRGLAYIQSAGGTFISFATAPGKVAADGEGRNSPYTASLLQHIQEPGVPVELMFKNVRQTVIDKTKGQQTPWESSSLVGTFAFKPTEPLSSSPRPTKTPPLAPTPTTAVLPQLTPSETPLISKTTGANYAPLRDLLTAGRWIEADQETTRVILKVTGRMAERTLRLDDIDRFSCGDLRIINQLWLTASDGKFGFSVQGQIYQSLGGARRYSQNIWRKFGEQVGWRSGSSWLPYSDYTFNLNAKAGHLPSFLTFLSEGGGYRRGERLGEEETTLISLISRCEL